LRKEARFPRRFCRSLIGNKSKIALSFNQRIRGQRRNIFNGKTIGWAEVQLKIFRQYQEQNVSGTGTLVIVGERPQERRGREHDYK
jgi:hypothetical protein